MARRKHIKVAEVNDLPNVYSKRIEGSLEKFSQIVSNRQNLTLELACGNGEYTTGLAKLYPDRFFIGVDRKPNRIWRGAITVKEEGLTNAVFLNAHIERIEQLIPPQSVEHIWIPFPEPHPERGGRKKRVIHQRFLSIYRKLLKTDGVLHLKTDHKFLFDYAHTLCGWMGLTVVKSVPDLRNTGGLTPEESIMTRFEYDHLRDGRKIYYISFLLDNFDLTKIPKYE